MKLLFGSKYMNFMHNKYWDFRLSGPPLFSVFIVLINIWFFII